MDNFLFSINTTFPVFLLIVLGGFLKKIGLIDKHFSNIADKFVFKVCLPCLLYKDLSEIDIHNDFDGEYVVFCFIATLISIITIWFLARLLLKDKSMVGAFVQCSYRSSAAILGVAFIQNIYGSSGMAPIMILASVPLYNIFAVVILVIESNEPADSSSNFSLIRNSITGILKNPIIIGIAIGLCASYFRIELPGIIYKPISNLAAIASPLALVSLGASFEGRKALAKLKHTFAAASIKLIILAAIFLPPAVYFGFRDQKLIAIVIMLASPSTPTAYIMAKNMHGDATLSASIIVMTTLLSSITLTGWIYIMKALELIQ